MKKIFSIAGRVLFAALIAIDLMIVAFFINWEIQKSQPLQPSEMLACGEDSPRTKWGLKPDSVARCFVARDDVAAAAYRSHGRDQMVEKNIKRWDKTTADDAAFWRKVKASGKMPVYDANGVKIPHVEAYFIRLSKDRAKVVIYKP